MLEKQIERNVRDYAKVMGVISYKFTSPSRRSVPDDLFFRVDGLSFLIEFKAPGKKPTPSQLREHKRLRDQNVPVFVVDDIEEGRALIVRIIMAKGLKEIREC